MKNKRRVKRTIEYYRLLKSAMNTLIADKGHRIRIISWGEDKIFTKKELQDRINIVKNQLSELKK